jgi:DNA repair protein RecN (Recombination protein N)
MIQYLQIQDLALIDEITLEFEEGFTCITGETGAGKSILLGALAMLSGNRLDRTIIRHDQDFCKVDATILISDPERINRKLAELDLPECEEGALILSRLLHKTKLPKIQINGTTTTLGNLVAIGEYWIDFHGSGEPQKLFKERYQLEILDLYAQSSVLLITYQDAYREWQQIQKQLSQLKQEKQLSDDEIHYLRDQVQKIDDLGVDPDSLLELEQHYQRMSRSEEFIQLLQSLQRDLFDEGGATEKLASSMQWTQSIEQIDPDTRTLWQRIESIAIELDDIAGEISDLVDSVNLDEDSIDILKSKMESWMELKRKYGKTPEHILKARQDMADRLATHSDIESTLTDLENRLAASHSKTIALGKSLTENRKTGAKKLASRVSDNLRQLGFNKALFEINILEEPTPREYGTSRCQILFAPNPGQPLLPLNKIASSGETARVMLALKAVLAEYDATPVLVFDEVDANVGGEIGKAVGREIAALSKNHQIFCVTHLPQVAALADEHFVVKKSQTDDSTNVVIEQLDKAGENRIAELARMLGDRNSQTALTHARELISLA